MDHTALLVMEVQTARLSENLYNKQNVLSTIKRLISCARESGTEVIFVRHQEPVGEELEYGSDGWQLYNEIAPVQKEKVFEKKYSSAFEKTNLQQYINSRKITNIILMGLLTEYSIDDTIKSAFEHGYQIIIPEETNTTLDNEYLPGEKLYQFYHDKIWNHRYAKVLPIMEVEEMLKSQKL